MMPSIQIKFRWVRIASVFLFFLMVWIVFTNVLGIVPAFIRTVFIFIFFASVAWLNLTWLIPSFLARQKTTWYAIATFAVCVGLALVRMGFESFFEIRLDIFLVQQKQLLPNVLFLFLLVLSHLFVVMISLIYYFSKQWVENARREALLKSEKIEAELNLLKSQVNPHFLFNTLNNIYALTYLNDGQAAATILKLSDMMRYMIYECAHKQVAVNKEITFLQNYLELQKLKSKYYGKIKFTTPKISNEYSIPPLLLLPFFENLFKHSDLENKETGYASVELSIEDNNRLSLTMENTFDVSAKNNLEHSGFGVRNVRQRLGLLYKSDYELETVLKKNIYSIKLTIPLYDNLRIG